MGGFNPCCCWSLKDGCVTVGIWSLIYCVAQMGIFGWQTAAIKFYRDRAANTLLPAYAGTYDTYDQRFPGYYERYYQSPEEQFYTALFVVQILNLIGAFFLLFASVGLIYGVHTNSRYLVWPWFPCMAGSTLASLAYCVTWWAGEVDSYWLVLTIIEIILVIVNIYCLLAVIVQYRRIVAGISDAREPYYQAKPSRVYFDNNGDYSVKPVLNNSSNYATDEGRLNQAYSPDHDYRQKAFQPDPYPHEPYQPSTLPLTHSQAPPIQTKFPLQEDLAPKPVSHEFVHPVKPNLSGSQAALQQWQEGVMLVPDAEPANPTLQRPPPPSPPKDDLRHAQSAGDLTHADDVKGRRRHRHRDDESRSHRRHRSSDGRSRKSSRDYDDSDDDKSRRRHRSSGRSHSRGQDKFSDSDTGYSRSEASRRHHKRRHRSRDDRDDKSERSRATGSRRHKKSLRDVKREDAGRNGRDGDRSPNASSDGAGPPPLPPKYSPAPPYPGPSSGAGGITIPQHIVIPPTAKGKSGQPQRFHINSEITISYSDRSTPNPSDSERLTSAAGPHPPPRPSRPSSGGPHIEPLTSPAEDNDEDPHNASRGSNHGSTAV